MGRSDQEHFDTYTPQNRIKHKILAKYFKAYIKSLGNHANAFHYIDGFAGCGKYEGVYVGSPLIALSLLSQQKKPWSASFVESDADFFDHLVSAVSSHPAARQAYEGLYLRKGAFADYVDEILARSIHSRVGKVATFAFVDPCGVRGVRMKDLSNLLAMEYGECLLFWNYDGLNRWLGGVLKSTHPIEGIIEFFGDPAAVDAAIRIYKTASTSHLKERQLRDLYIQWVATCSGAQFILPFRFDAKDSDRTSHYLVHCSSHGLGFKIMKEVMGSESVTSDDGGLFEFLSDSETAQQLSMFPRPQEEEARRQILQRVAEQPCRVRVFTDEWVRRPGDFYRGVDYKRMILELEKSGDLEVWDNTNSKLTPASKRMRLGAVTLGEDRFLHLSTKTT